MAPSIAVHTRSTVRGLLSRSPAFAALPAADRSALRSDMEKIAVYLARPDGIPGNVAAGGAAVAVDLPAFVSDLINGVFDAIVNSSVEQMKAYAVLLADAARSVEQFTRVGDPSARALIASHRQRAVLASLRAVLNPKPRRAAVKRGTRRRAGSSPRA